MQTGYYKIDEVKKTHTICRYCLKEFYIKHTTPLGNFFCCMNHRKTWRRLFKNHLKKIEIEYNRQIDEIIYLYELVELVQKMIKDDLLYKVYYNDNRERINRRLRLRNKEKTREKNRLIRIEKKEKDKLLEKEKAKEEKEKAKEEKLKIKLQKKEKREKLKNYIEEIKFKKGRVEK